MMLTRTLATIALIALMAATAAASALDAEMCGPGDQQKFGHANYYWTLEDRFAGNESYRVFCGQLEGGACEGDWKPVSVTMYLYWEEANDCALTVQAELHESDSIDPQGAGAGRLIATSEPIVVGPFKPAGLWAVTVAMPTDTPAMSGPCFASIRFLDTCSDLPQMVAAPGACEQNRSWTDRGTGWVDMRDLELPGNLSAYATFECQRPGEGQPVAWSTIKSMYGTKE